MLQGKMPEAKEATRGSKHSGYRWFRVGDLNAFFALMFDNMANMVILAGILIGAFHFPKELVLYRMVPGTAMGVLVGDLTYAWMAGRLALRTGRDDVTAMPLGLNAPSVFGMSFAVIGPAYLATHDAMLAWKIGMAVTVLVGVFKIGLSFCGNAVRSIVPRAALLGSIGGAGIALIGVLPLLKIFADPIPGLLALSLLLVTLVGRMQLPGRIPGALASALVGIAAYYVLRMAHLGSPLLAVSTSNLTALHLSLPWPSLGFLGGLSKAWGYLPIALPFALSTVVGGIDNTESAAVAGDEYDTRAILLTEGCCTLAAGLCGGVVESTPYIGHPAFKSMGAGAGYAILTGLFIGIGGNCRRVAVLCGLGSGVGDRPDAGVYRAGGDCAGVSGQSAKAWPGRRDFAAAFVCLCDYARDRIGIECTARYCRSDWRRGGGDAAHAESAGQRVHHYGDSVGSGDGGID